VHLYGYWLLAQSRQNDIYVINKNHFLQKKMCNNQLVINIFYKHQQSVYVHATEYTQHSLT